MNYRNNDVAKFFAACDILNKYHLANPEIPLKELGEKIAEYLFFPPKKNIDIFIKKKEANMVAEISHQALLDLN